MRFSLSTSDSHNVVVEHEQWKTRIRELETTTERITHVAGETAKKVGIGAAVTAAVVVAAPLLLLHEGVKDAIDDLRRPRGGGTPAPPVSNRGPYGTGYSTHHAVGKHHGH
jgi:hypothetical protein